MHLDDSYFLRINSELGSPRLWKLDEANQPANEFEFLQSILFLENHPEWVNDNEDEARSCFTHLSMTDLSSETEASGIARKIQASLVRSYPHLFPVITLRLGKEKAIISKSLLLEKSEKFRTMFSRRWNDQAELNIEEPYEVDSQVLKSFLRFLTHGEVQCTNENVPHLLRLAQEHLVTELTALCHDYLKEKMRRFPLSEMLRLAVRYNIADLKWQCLIFASENSEDGDFKAILQQLHDSLAAAPIADKGKLEEAIFILEAGAKCTNSGIAPCLMGSRKTRTVWLDRPLSDAPFLKTLFEVFAIDGLKITGDFATDQDLAQLAQMLPMPHFLLFRGSKIESIPKKWLDQVKEIDCSDCTNLTVLEVPSASQIAIRDCRSLIQLFAPEAIKIDCSRSSLRALHAPLAQIIYSNTCPIQSLYAPTAKKIVSHDCNQLREVYAPMAEEINCHNCRALEKFAARRVKRVELSHTLLISLNVPFALYVNCSDNYLLGNLNAPQAKHLICQNNKELPGVEAPMADTLIISGCPKLSMVFAPMAKKIDCKGQPITFLEAGMAEEIDCSDTQLTSLKALKAIKINCSRTPIRVLEAPVVEEIDCSWTQLTILDVPKGKTVKSRSCRSLEKLNAPMATLIDCRTCDRLISLMAQMAEEMLMMDCSTLKWLTAPLAKRINGSRCSLLEGLDALSAEWINCPDCLNLKHMNAPQLKEGNFEGCLSLVMPQLSEHKECAKREPQSWWKRVKDPSNKN